MIVLNNLCVMLGLILLLFTYGYVILIWMSNIAMCLGNSVVDSPQWRQSINIGNRSLLDLINDTTNIYDNTSCIYIDPYNKINVENYSIMSTYLNSFCVNIWSLRSKIWDLKNLITSLAECKISLDILLICETFMTKNL